MTTLPETQENEENMSVAAPTDASTTPENSTPERGGERSEGRRGGHRERRDRNDRGEKPKKEFEEKLLEVRRVTRVTTGGRRMSFRASILVGNKKGKIGVGVAKGVDVAIAVKKATNEAYKNVFEVPITAGGTVPYMSYTKYKSSVIKLIPASSGTGLKAGSTVRSVLELAGYSNMLSKIVGTNNGLNNAINTIKSLMSYKAARNSKKTESKTEEIQSEEVVAPKKAPKSKKA